MRGESLEPPLRRQGCEAMSPTSDIETDTNRGCEEDQVAFFQSAQRRARRLRE